MQCFLRETPTCRCVMNLEQCIKMRIFNGGERRLCDLLLEQCRKRGWIKVRGKQRTDSTHVLAAIRTLRRLECVGETMRHAWSAAGRSRSRLAPGADGR